MKKKSKCRSKEKLKVDNKISSGYRGAFYNDTTEKEFYEFGAHFSYKELYNKLSVLKTIQTKQAQKDLLMRMTYNTKELLKKNIKLKITRNKSKPTKRPLSSNKNLSVNTFTFKILNSTSSA